MRKYLGMCSAIYLLLDDCGVAAIHNTSVWGGEHFILHVLQSLGVTMQRGGYFLCALLGSAVEEVNAFVFRTTSLCEMYKQRYFIAFDQKNTDL